jgi:hypothetical protein
MTLDWLRLRCRKQRRPVPAARREKQAEASEEDTNLLKRIAAGVALNKFPPR